MQLIVRLYAPLGFHRIFRFADNAAFSCNHDNTVGCTRTVDSRRCGIFQYLDAFHITRIERFKTVAHREAVDDNQWIAAGTE